jgi:hypothetical protein
LNKLIVGVMSLAGQFLWEQNEGTSTSLSFLKNTYLLALHDVSGLHAQGALWA